MTLHIGELKLDSLGFIAVFFLQATFTYAVSGFWPVRKHSWYRNSVAVISALPLGHSLLSSQPDLMKVTAAFLGTLTGLIIATWLCEKSKRTNKFVWSCNGLILVSMIACLSDMNGASSFFSGMLVTVLASMAFKALRKPKEEASEPRHTEDSWGVPVKARPTHRARRIILPGSRSDGNVNFGTTANIHNIHIPASRLNWHPRNN